ETSGEGVERAVPCKQLITRVHGVDRAARHQHHPIDDPLELVEVVRRDDYTHARASQREQDLTELTQGDRIEAVRGLIQQQQGDAADQCGRDLDSPALTLGKLVQPAIRERLGSERLIDWRAAQLGEPVEKFCDTQMSLEARALRDVANSVCGAV